MARICIRAPKIFSMVRQFGMSYLEAAKASSGEPVPWNGAAMRISPIGLLFHDSERLYEIASAQQR